MTDELENPPIKMPPDLDAIVEEEETVEIQQMPAENFIREAQSPGMRQLIDRDLDAIRDKTGASWKQMLRGYYLILRSIAVSMPWDEEDGLDAKRLHTDEKVMLPSWRDCIGILTGQEFTKVVDEPEEGEAPDEEQSEE